MTFCRSAFKTKVGKRTKCFYYLILLQSEVLTKKNSLAGGAFTKTGWSRLGTVLEGGEKNCRYFPVLTGDCRLLGGGPGAALRGTEAGGSLESQKINKQYRPGRVATVILATVPRCMLSAVDWPFPVPLPSVLGD